MKKVLLVEDEIQIIDIITEYLQAIGYEVTTCTDGIEGYVKVQQENFDLIITDIMMETMNGDEMIDLIKKSNSECKIIVVSAISNEIDVQIITNLGIDAYIEKPFSLEQLRTTISEVI